MREQKFKSKIFNFSKISDLRAIFAMYMLFTLKLMDLFDALAYRKRQLRMAKGANLVVIYIFRRNKSGTEFGLSVIPFPDHLF